MTESDLRKLRIDYVRNTLPGIIVALLLILIIMIYFGLNHNTKASPIILISLAFLIGGIVSYLITKKHRQDLKMKSVITERAIVKEKSYKLDYEVGSASQPVNLLSFFSIKSIAQREMKELQVYSISINEERFFIEEELYNKIKEGDTVLIRRAANTKLFLGIETK